MFWYVITFIAGTMFGIVMLFLILALLHNAGGFSDGDSDKDNPYNEDGTPKRITFNKDDL